MPLLGHSFGPYDTTEGFQPVHLLTDRGQVKARWYPAPDSRRAVLYVGGAGGGFDTPAQNLYPRLCGDLVREGISGLRLRFRHSTLLDEAVPDVLAGLRYLEEQGVDAAGLVGHSFGGAVVIQAAALSPTVRAVVTLATQSFGTDPVTHLQHCPILLIHGTADTILPAVSSQTVYRRAPDPKKLVILEGAGHVLDEDAKRVHDEVRSWITANLRSESTTAP